MKKIDFVFICFMCIKLFGQGVPYNQEFQVNTYIQYAQWDPTVSALPGGGFVVCWRSDGQDGSDWGIYGQIYDAEGSKKGAEFRVNNYTQDSQWNQTVTTLTSGDFVVCWVSDGNDGSGPGIYGKIYNAEGSEKSGEFRVNTYTRDSQNYPTITALIDGGFVVCWASDGNDGSGSGIYGKMYNADGSTKDGEFQVNTYTEDDQSFPTAAALMEGGFVVCWLSWYQDGSGFGIYGQLYNSEGLKKGGEFQINTYTEGWQENPTVTALPGGGFMVCWSSWYHDGSEDGVYGQLYDAEGLKKGGEFQINTYTQGYQTNPTVAALSGGGFIVCWESWKWVGVGLSYMSEYCVYSQLYDAEGSKEGGNFR